MRHTRHQLLKTTAAVGPALMLSRVAAPAQAAAGQLKGMNVVVFLTDQERGIQHFPSGWAAENFPSGWAAENLPGDNRLRRYGLTFRQAFTDACMCSPARSTWMTGFFPAQHGVKYTLEAESFPPKNPQVELPLDLPNLATVMKSAGLNPVYKGKFHCVTAAAGGENWVPQDVGQYGWTRWNPPDAGANQNLDQAGGGIVNNDFRYMTPIGDVASGAEHSGRARHPLGRRRQPAPRRALALPRPCGRRRPATPGPTAAAPCSGDIGITAPAGKSASTWAAPCTTPRIPSGGCSSGCWPWSPSRRRCQTRARTREGKRVAAKGVRASCRVRPLSR
jgi:Sulfatase